MRPWTEAPARRDRGLLKPQEAHGRRDRDMPVSSGRARTKNRVVRVSDAVWDAARSRAGRDGDRLSDVIRRALIEYAGLPPGTSGTVGGADRPGTVGGDQVLRGSDA